MAQNHDCEGKVMPFTNSSGATITSGSVVEVGNRIGVALGDVEDGAAGELAMEEVWLLPKTAADDMSAIGTLVYWDATAGEITLTATDNPAAGFVFRPAAALATSVYVKLNA